MTGLSEGLRAEVDVPGRLSASVTAPAGAVVGVIGPNGSGKTTLLRALAGLVSTGAEVVVAGEPWTGRPVRERSVGFVFQDQSLFPHLSARDNVAFGPRSRGVARARAAEIADDLLDRFGVGALKDRRPGQLSGGQAQRVAIARALAIDPALLLLDEPFAGLDVGVAMALRLELARHLASYAGVTLLVTHDALDALTLADTLVVLDEGRVAQTGPPADVAARPVTEHVARLVGLNVIRDGDTFTAFSPTVVTVSLDEPTGSARHHWQGTVASVAPHGDALRILVHSDRDLLADVTPAAATELELVPGRAVWLSVKETAVTSYAAPGDADDEAAEH